MAEEVRGVWVTVQYETNKRSVTLAESVDSLDEAIEKVKEFKEEVEN